MQKVLFIDANGVITWGQVDPVNIQPLTQVEAPLNREGVSEYGTIELGRSTTDARYRRWRKPFSRKQRRRFSREMTRLMLEEAYSE